MKNRILALGVLLLSGFAHSDNWCQDQVKTDNVKYEILTAHGGVSFVGTIAMLRFAGDTYQPLNVVPTWPNGAIHVILKSANPLLARDYEFALPLDSKWSDQAAQFLVNAKLQQKQIKLSACFAPYFVSGQYKNLFVVTSVFTDF